MMWKKKNEGAYTLLKFETTSVSLDGKEGTLDQKFRDPLQSAIKDTIDIYTRDDIEYL